LALGGTLGAGDAAQDQFIVFVSLSFVGLAALWVRQRSGSLYPAMVLHGSYNATVLLIQLSAS